MELVQWAARQPKQADGKRRARFACIRNTYGQLADTTLKTFLHWLPDRIFGTYNKGDHVYKLDGSMIWRWNFFFALSTVRSTSQTFSPSS